MITFEVKQDIFAYIAFGSNLGDRLEYFNGAEKRLSEIDGMEVLRKSSLYETEPHTRDGLKQPWYLNAVFEVQTRLSPPILFSTLKRIERDLGRVSVEQWAPRPVDLDLLFYDDLIMDEEGLQIPHREIVHRKFVLRPLCDLVPDKMHPVFKKSLRDLLKGCQDKHQCFSVSSCFSSSSIS